MLTIQYDPLTTELRLVDNNIYEQINEIALYQYVTIPNRLLKIYNFCEVTSDGYLEISANSIVEIN